LFALAGCFAEFLPLDCPATDPALDNSGDAEPLASVHPSSPPSFPRSKWTEVLCNCLLLSGPEDVRFSAPADFGLLTSTCDLLRRRETCDEFFFSDVVEPLRDNLGSDPLRFMGAASGLVAADIERRCVFV
jgi:hypothetical protein